ncbi:MAG: pyridoxal phosphate-dependent aminotransferase [Chloroflexi bacterium]|nr:pyridoxal phosphate-dependent aminotransferase [Chloroflexota bacterium]
MAVPNIAARTDLLKGESAFAVLARARKLESAGKDIIHLEIGEPDFPTPENIVEAGVQALQDGHTHYGPTPGLLPCREAIARYVQQGWGVDASAENVVVTPGAKPIVFAGILATVNPGDEAIYPDPGFPTYDSMLRFAGAARVPLTLYEERQFRWDLDELRDSITDKTRLIILNAPHNPTGGVFTAEELGEIADMVRGKPIWVLSDEIYSRIVYDGSHASILAHPGMQEQTILLDGHSKTYAMTGWRLGYGVMPVPLAEKIGLILNNATSCTASFTQMAGIEALEGPQDSVVAMVAEFRRRRDAFIGALNAIDGLSCLVPQGAFYAFCNVKELGVGSARLERYWLEEAGVASLSGTGFGAAGEGYVRFSFANSLENLMAAAERIEAAMPGVGALAGE